jgi:uncharacterized protein YjiS (DUF1127 family)
MVNFFIERPVFAAGRRRGRAMATTSWHTGDGGYRRRRAGLARLLHRMFRHVRRWRHGSAPPMLSDTVLRDIGLTRTDIEIEADKLFRKP